MPSIFLEIKVPENAVEYFKSAEFNPFRPLINTILVDTDDTTKLVQEIITEIKFQNSRNAATKEKIESL